MKVLVLGAGLQGAACAFDLLGTTDATVTLADRSVDRLPPFLGSSHGDRLTVRTLDARDPGALRDAVRGHELVLSALPYYLNVDAAAASIDAGAHFADLGGNTDIVRRQQEMHREAVDRGVSVVPDCGVAPGLVNILAAEGLRRIPRPESVKLYVGGLPQSPRPPLNYNIVYSLEGVLDYYTTPSWILREGKLTEVQALSELESVEFPAPVGRLEAFHTAGGASTMPFECSGRVRTLEYKTLRYPGHAAIMGAIRDLGLLDTAPVDAKGQRMAPRDLFIAVVDPRLRRAEPDLIVLRVEVAGGDEEKPARAVFQLVDRYDARHGVSAMMRTTAYSLSITGQLQVAGRIAPGVRPAWEVTPFRPYMTALKIRGVLVEELGEQGKGNREQ
jgi:lysine 6-dehydrogenase